MSFFEQITVSLSDGPRLTADGLVVGLEKRLQGVLEQGVGSRENR